MTRNELLDELEARKLRRSFLLVELRQAERAGADTDPVLTAIANNRARMDEVMAMLQRIDRRAA